MYRLPLPLPQARYTPYEIQWQLETPQPVLAPVRARVRECGRTVHGGYVVLEAHGRYRFVFDGLETYTVSSGAWVLPGKPVGTARKLRHAVLRSGSGPVLQVQPNARTAYPLSAFYPETEDALSLVQ